MNRTPRVFAATTLVMVLALGVGGSGRFASSLEERMSALESNLPAPPNASAVRRHLLERARFDRPRFEHESGQDADLFGFPPDAVAQLQQPQFHQTLLSEPAVLRAGQAWKAGPLHIRASHEKVRYQQHGAMVAARHLVAEIENTGASPVAYRVELRPHDRGRCEVRGARMHNALALMPQERAEIVVCAGGGKLRIERAEVLSISALGYAYLSKLSPLAVGQDATAAGAHAPDRRFERCSGMDTEEIAAWLREGAARWVDVADFFSRHNCERFRFFPGYRYREGTREVPADPESGAP